MLNIVPKKYSSRTNKRILLIGGGVLLAFSLYLLVFLVPDVLTSSSGAQSMTLAQAAEQASDQNLYTTIEDGEWNCNSIVYIRGRSASSNTIITRYTEIFLTEGRVVLLAVMSDEMKCGDFETLKPSGYLTRMSDEKQQELTNDARLARFVGATDFLYLCGYCGTGNSFIGVIFGIIFAISGVVLLILGLRMKASAPTDTT